MTDQRQRGTLFIRNMIDAALAGAGEDADVYGDPLRYFDNGRHQPLTLGIARAIGSAGWIVKSSQAGRRSSPSRERMDLEDLISMALIALGRQKMRDMAHNVQARDHAASAIWDTLHHAKIVLGKRPAA